MPPDLPAKGTANDWLERAKGNLIRAKQFKPQGAFWEDLCFDAQQAVEKAIKAVCISLQIDFPKTHDISELFVLLDDAGHVFPTELWEAGRLSRYAIETRYPGEGEPVTEEDYDMAIVLADQVIAWAETVLSSGRK